MKTPFLDRTGWEGWVNKIIKVFGASITDEDAAAIVSYQADDHGRKPHAVAKNNR